MDFLVKGGAAVEASSTSSSTTLARFRDAIPGHPLGDAAARQLMQLSFLPSFAKLNTALSATEQWAQFMSSPTPEEIVPHALLDVILNITGGGKPTKERCALLRVLVVKALRPERVCPALEAYVCEAFGSHFDWRAHCAVDLRSLMGDSRAAVPLLLCSEAGQDASGKVDALAGEKQLLQVAMGSAEGFAQADKLIALGAKTGCWVLLRNVHLCPDWLGLLEKRLAMLSPHATFRLFLTADMHPKLPSALLRACEVVVFESSKGVKANVQKFYSSLGAARIERAPAERGRLLALLAWLNAVVQERLRYAPLGWTKRYEFSETDAACAADVVDQWVDRAAGGAGALRAHVAPEDLPWEALRTLLSQSLFGGRVDHVFDQAALDSFIGSLFNADKYASGAVLAADHNGPLVTLPDGLGRQAFETWLHDLPDANPPSWIGLPATAEARLMTERAARVLCNLALLQGADASAGPVAAQGASVELAAALAAVEPWLSLLPSADTLPQVGADRLSQPDSLPLERWLARELLRGRTAVALVRGELAELGAYCRGEVKATNQQRALLQRLRRGAVPEHWRAHFGSSVVTLGDWVTDLVARAGAMQTRYALLLPDSASASAGAGKGASAGVAEALEAFSRTSFWAGGMFTPEAFVTATRQQTAQVNGWSLEDVELELLLDEPSTSASSMPDTLLHGVTLEGAHWDGRTLSLSDQLVCPLPTCRLRWSLKPGRGPSTSAPTSPAPASASRVSLPLYLTSLRASLMGEVRLCVPSTLPATVWAQRGVAVVLQAS